ncbi:MAG TPA: adenylate/guanylate cyclase domain-containing protein [Gaiellaceae bacterium]
MGFEPYLPRLVRGWTNGPGVREIDGTLVSVDLSGFTRLSERLQAKGRAGAEELVLAVSGVYEGLIGIAERRGGDVLKFRGDALLLFFHGPGHERRACRASLDMQWLIRKTGKMMSSVGSVTLKMSTGVYTGPCHFFLVDSTHRELIVAGPAATATIELESAASAGQILVSERTAEALDPSWLGAARAGARLLRDVDDSDLEPPEDTEPVPLELELYVPQPLRAQLLLEAGEAEHRHVTAAFLKYTGTDELIVAGRADDLHARLGRLAQRLGGLTDELGLTWLESDIDVGGGKLYLVGGAPSSTGADEDRMLRLVRAVLDDADEIGLELRAGVNRGPAFCGDIGATTRRTYAVMGDTVNLAARLTGRAAPGAILATADVLDRARLRFETTAQPFLMKGKERPITAYTVGAPTGEREEDGHAELPFVGRDVELARLTEAIDAARLRKQQLVEIVGEPGIGKSRLVEELKMRALGFTQLVGRCDAYSSASPYAVFRSLLRPLVGITPELDAAEAGAQLTPWVSAVMPDLAPMLPLLALPLGATVAPTKESEEIEPQFRRARLHETVASFLTRILLMPTLLAIEDAHWIDDASRDLLLHLTRAPELRPWLVCVTRRPQGPEYADPNVDGHLALELDQVRGDAARALAIAAAGDGAFTPDVVEAIVERSAGNPLYIRELVAASRGARDVASLPDSIETLILARMDTLAPEDRFLMRNASVFGASFELDVLSAALEDTLADVVDLQRWDRLGEFVTWEGAGTLRFRHDLFRAVAYEGLSFRRRREMHGRIARIVEARAGAATDEVADLLSLHFHRAEEPRPTWQYSVVAGKRARDRSANVEATELFQRAIDVAVNAGAAASEIAEVAEALGDAAELTARYDQSEAAYALARKLAKDDVITQTHLLRKEGVLRERSGRYTEALRRYGRALKVLEAAPESVEKTRSRADLELAYAGVKYRQGRFVEARERAARAAAEAEAGADRTRLAHAYYIEHIAAVNAGRRDHEHRDAALAILEEVGDLARLTNLQNNVGIESYFDGRWDEAIDWYRRSGESARRVGDVVNVARAANNEGEVLSDRGHLDEARELFEDALRAWRAANYPVGIALATANLGRVAARAGEFETARRLLDEALELFTELGAEAFVDETVARIAECLVFEGRHKEASAVLQPLLERGGAMAERLAGYAVIQSRAPYARAKPHFEAAREAATSSPYELALTLRAMADTNGGDAEEADEILRQLGIVSTPRVPLP